MAPVEPDALDSNSRPLSFFAGHMYIVATALAVILNTTSRAARSLPPSYNTRQQQSARRRSAFLFASLALVGLSLASFFGASWRQVSYARWAQTKEADAAVPNSLWSGWYGAVDDGMAARWQFGRWFRDVDLNEEINGVAVKSIKGFWWTSQYLTGLITWAVFVGIESRRRNLSKLTVYAFISLAQFASLSVAQNLFFITLLYTPTPLAGAVQNPAWAPHPAVYLTPAIFFLNAVDMTPSLAAGVTSGWAVWIVGFSAPLVLAFITQLLPSTFGRAHVSTRAAHRSYATVFYWLSVVSFVFYAKRTYTTVVNFVPETTTLQYILNTQPSTLDKAKVAFWRLLNIVSEHPLISLTAWDVILSGTSLVLWSYVRGLDTDRILQSGGVPFVQTIEDAVDAVSHIGHDSDLKHESEFEHTDHEDEHKHVSFPPDSELATTAQPVKRTRGRPKKSESATPASGTLRRSTRNIKTPQPDTSEDEYTAPPSIMKDIANTEHDDGAPVNDPVENAEALALTWGIAVVGGLGVASSATFGAEVVGK